MFRLIRPLVAMLAVLALLSIALPAAAQNPSFTIMVSDPDPVTITAGQSQSVSLMVTLMGDNFGCAQDTAFPVAVATSATRTTATANPADLTFQSGASLYSSAVPALGPYNQSQPVQVEIVAPGSATSDFTESVTVTATFEGGDYTASGCGPTAYPGAEDSATVQVNVVAPSSGGTGGNGGGGGTGGNGNTGGNGGDNGTDGDEDTDDSPIGTLLVPLALIGAAALARRRRS